MAHNVESMIYAGPVPWHGLGTQVSETISTKEAIKEAGLDWTVKAIPLYTGKEFGAQMAQHRAIIRESDKRILGECGSDYVPLQNTEAFKFFDPFLKAGEAQIESAGSLRQGQNIWVLAKLNKAPLEVVKNDAVEKFLLLSNTHRGGYAVKVGFTPIRVVCANTLAMAESDNSSQLLRVAHSTQMINNLEKVQEIVNAADAQFEATAEQYRFLASRQVSKKDIQQFVKQVFMPNAGDSQRTQTREALMVDNITRLFETGMGNAMPGVAGTAWALYNAGTQFLTYEKGKDEDKRLYNLWFGSSHKQNDDMLSTVLQMVAV